ALLLFDEPLSALDQARREELIPYLQRVRDEVRLPMLYVSHHPDEVRRLAEAVHRLDQGRASCTSHALPGATARASTWPKWCPRIFPRASISTRLGVPRSP